VRLPHPLGERLVVLPQLRQHVQRLHVLGVVVAYPLQPADLPDGVERQLAQLPHPLGDRIRHGIDLVRLLVQQQVVVAEVWTAHVPVEVLGLEVEGEGVRQKAVERRGGVPGALALEVGRGDERRGTASLDGRWSLGGGSHGDGTR
jgi:hypothetical protein